GLLRSPSDARTIRAPRRAARSLGIPPFERSSNVLNGVVRETAENTEVTVSMNTDFPFAPLPHNTAKHCSAVLPVIPYPMSRCMYAGNSGLSGKISSRNFSHLGHVA